MVHPRSRQPLYLAPHTALAALRIAVTLNMLIHGLTRLSLGGVVPFGEWLLSIGIPGGVAIAWTLTITEIVGGLLLISGRLVAPLAAFFSLELLAGIWLVHLQEGWFVVGLGRNGSEYSVLLVVCFVLVGLTGGGWHNPGGEEAEGGPSPSR